jgi:phage virion morphogenesis protein
MSGVGISISIAEDGITPILRNLIALSADLTPAHEAIGADLLFKAQRRFELERDPDGNPWPPSIRALAEGGRTLTDQANLVNSLTYNADATKVEVGTNLVYGAIHQTGGSAGRGGATKLPARPYLGLEEDDPRAIEEAYERLLLGAAAEGAFA